MIILSMFTYDARYCSWQKLTETSEKARWRTHQKAEHTLKMYRGGII